MGYGIGRLMGRLLQTTPVYAHCDIPCGIYDPHAAQIAALTVIRMNQLIAGLAQPGDPHDKTAADVYENTLSRYIATKEGHAEIVKREVTIIMGDYFRPEHAEKYPNLMMNAWNILKLASKNKQAIDPAAADQLLAEVQTFAETFWDSKGVPTKRQSSNQTVGGELVVPAN
jgi:nickel superoxide dismutase